jgi:hypothetical protein
MSPAVSDLALAFALGAASLACGGPQRAADAATAACRAPAVGEGIAIGESAMIAICQDVFVDPSTTNAERDQLRRDYDLATRHIATSLGRLESAQPTVILCRSDACILHFTGPKRRSWTLSPGDRVPGASYTAVKPTIIVIRCDEGTAGHLRHEMVHIALGFGRRGLAGRRFDTLPLWFHEGVATSIADAPACSQPLRKGIDDLRKLDGNAAWADYTSDPVKREATYCQARAEVDAWARRYGKERFFTLLDAVREGGSFDDAYGPLLTQ